MKKAAILLVVLVLCAWPLYAQTAPPHEQSGEAPAPGGQMQMKCPMMQMPVMPAGDQMQGMMQMCPRMGQMMGHGMMARDMMQMMTDVIKTQQKIIRGLSPVEKKEMMKETDKMLEQIEKMMSDMRGMMMHGMISQPAPPPVKQTEPAQEKLQENAPAPHHH